MKAEDLIALAAGHGIDLRAVAGAANNLDGIAKLRRLTPRERAAGLLAVAETASGSETRVSHPPAWSHAELGLAMSGPPREPGKPGRPREPALPRMPTLAAMYSFARDDANYGELFRGLIITAMRVCRDEAWPMRVGRDDPPYAYVNGLAGLVLDADRHARFFAAAPMLYPIYMGVSEEVWRVRLDGKYHRLKARYDGWLDSARSHINRKLSTALRETA